MHFIIKTVVDEKQQQVSLEIITHANRISAAILLLEQSARAFIKEERGKQESENAKIIDIHNFSQVHEPIIDTMLIYRLSADSHSLHIYQRKSSVVPAGWIYNQTIASDFRRVVIFSIIMYDALNTINAPPPLPSVELIEIGPAKIKVPKAMTVVPMCNVIEELKKSSRFLKCYENEMRASECVSQSAAV